MKVVAGDSIFGRVILVKNRASTRQKLTGFQCGSYSVKQYFDDYSCKENVAQNEEKAKKSKKEWKLTDFKLGTPLGKGRFGSVYLAKEKKSNYVVGKLQLLFWYQKI